MRFHVALRERYREILSHVGLILFLAGLLMLTPLAVLLSRPGELGHASGFLIPASVLATAGILMRLAFRAKETSVLTVQEGGVIVVLSWVVVALFSAWPLMQVQGLSFTQAVFESVSGWTTTGLSVVDVTKSTRLILFWRSIMQLAGGAGLAIIMLAAVAGPVGPGLSVAEGRTDQLVPHVRESVKLVVYIYAGYALFGTLAFWVAGMGPFDALNHAFAAVSTGGFSTRPESIGYWNSAGIEAVTIALMLLGNLNFLTAYLLFHGKFKAVFRNGEVRTLAVLLIGCSMLLFFLVTSGLYQPLDKSVRVAVFETVSALTTTGFSTIGYSAWKPVGFMVLIVLMIIGGGACSTAGGIKQYRVYLLFKSLVWEIRRALMPRTAVVENYVWQGERKDFISERRIRQSANFLFLYLTVYILGAGILAAHGYGLKESLFEFASALSTVGLSLGVTKASSPPLVLWTETLGMFLGRLEFMVVVISLVKILKDFSGLIRLHN